jgi:hypothetical protein
VAHLIGSHIPKNRERAVEAGQPSPGYGNVNELLDSELVEQYCAVRERIRGLIRDQSTEDARNALAQAKSEQDLLFGELFCRCEGILKMSIHREVYRKGFCPTHWSEFSFSEECMGSVQSKVVENICAYRGGSLRGFLQELAKNVVVDRWRNEMGRGSERRWFEPFEPDRTDPLTEGKEPFRSKYWQDSRELSADLDRTDMAVKLLAVHIQNSQHGRRSGCAIASHIWAGRSFEEIAEKRLTSITAVYKLFSRDYKELRELAAALGLG